MALIVAATFSSGCASIVSGHNQSLSVITNEAGETVSGADCKLVNNKGTWYVKTPGSVTVSRSFENLSVNCEKAGHAPGVANVKSSTKAMAFGNALFGGVIGAGVDMATGAAYDYPTEIAVEMGATTDLPVTPPVDAAPAPDQQAKAETASTI